MPEFRGGKGREGGGPIARFRVPGNPPARVDRDTFWPFIRVGQVHPFLGSFGSP